MVQLRCKRAGDDDVLRAADLARFATSTTLFWVNDRPDLAAAASADTSARRMPRSARFASRWGRRC